MREIKFRAWDGEFIRYDVTGFEHGKDNEMSGVFIDGDYYAIIGFGNVDAHPDAVVMQFTGLHDKNGKEIYEGDILESPYFIPNFSIEYDNDNAAFTSLGLPSEWKECIVLGNIYENPELLEKS